MKKMFNVINNFTDNKKFNSILENVKINFPWHLEPNTNIFKHILITTNKLNKREISPFSYKISEALLEKLQHKIIYSLQIKFIVPHKKIKADFFNETIPENLNYIGILFLNTSDSFVKVSGEEQIKSEENRFITFNKNIPYYHSIPTEKSAIYLEVEYGDI